MYTTNVIVKLKCLNPHVQPHAVLNIWSPTRDINFIQKCKDCLNMVLKAPAAKEQICKVAESCCAARMPVMEQPESVFAPAVTTQRGANVVIVGAGMAGLSAANHLHDNGIQTITVLEASERPGGRICSGWFGDSIIEFGSEIDREPATNPIVQTAINEGYAGHQLNGADRSRGLLLRSDGRVIPYPVSHDVFQLFKQMWSEIQALEAQESGQGKQSPQTLLGSRIEQEVRTFPSKYQPDAERLFHGLYSLVHSRSNHDSSLIVSTNFGDYIQLPGSKIKIPLGYFGEANTLYEALPPEKVLFNKSVSKIRWGGVAEEFPRAIVICEDGESFLADYVIITIPLGVLKDIADTLFVPGVPALKFDAIMKIPVDLNNKIFVKFTEPFWKWKRDFKKICFESTQLKCVKGWMKGVCSIEPVKGSDHVVCVTVVGPEARCMESVSDHEIMSGVVTLLQQSSPGKKIPQPASIKRSSWCNNPNFLGYKSYMGPGVTPQDFYNLASPLPDRSELVDPVLLFAGEATCPVHFGTVKGSEHSGVREAERLIHFVRLQNEKLKRQQSISFECED